MSNLQALHRRGFLKTAGRGTAFLLAAPAFIPSRAFGANERVVTGHIGVGGQGMGNMRKFLNQAAAICDVDSSKLEKAANLLQKETG